jgi:hypothetical protein
MTERRLKTSRGTDKNLPGSNTEGKFPWVGRKSLTSPRFLAMVRKFGKNAVVRVS